uniref:Cation channel sperm associated auxiliary subunit delta n=2 Tax=Latimeria chalumnae TaxID=7897 RepID=M3XK91_LATCH|nr:PREDICTED: cation channel sperm-associated protein subunit delta isoform X1 [Latimeria chalumnae]|eukprot:XP_005989903.1 PREDICTED: cation channel sperm-associated protein subunit delta isoform X1 [Latimeria chalumnae]
MLSIEAFFVKIVNLSVVYDDSLLWLNEASNAILIDPIVDPKIGSIDFHHCHFNTQKKLTEVRGSLMSCPVQFLNSHFYAGFDEVTFYIDMFDKLQLSAEFIPKPATAAFPLVMVTKPQLVAFDARMVENGRTPNGNKKYLVVIKLEQQQFTVGTEEGFHESSREGGLCTLTLDVLNKGIFCKDVPAVKAVINVGCPPGKHIRVLRNVTGCDKGKFSQAMLQNNFTYEIHKKIYDPKFLGRTAVANKSLWVTYDFAALGCPLYLYHEKPWVPVLELWKGKEFVEFVNAEFVLFEIYGVHDYEYTLSVKEAGCISEPQNWTTMLNDQRTPDPHTAWTRMNYQNCHKETSLSMPVVSPNSKYQVLGGKLKTKNTLHFQKHSGFYVFKVIVVDPFYSYCDLSTTFSVYVYGTLPPPMYPPHLILAMFLSIIFVTILLGFVIPMVLNWVGNKGRSLLQLSVK